MTKKQRITQGILGMIALFGCIVGPMSWYDSFEAATTYREFSENGQVRTVQIVSKHADHIYRVVTNTVDIAYKDSKTNETKFVEDVDVNGLYYDKLKPGMKVDAYFKGNEVILKEDYNWKNLPPFKKPFWGMILTLLSYGYIGNRILKNRKQNKTS